MVDQLDLILMLHARVHAASVSGAAEPTMEDRLLDGLTDDQLRRRPQGMNSLAWLLWHTTRIEDVTANLLVAGQPQVLDDGWLARLGLSRRDVGTGMSDDDVADVSGSVDLAALRAYRAATGRRSRDIIRGLRPDQLDKTVDAARIGRLFGGGALAEQARWLEAAWEGRPLGFFLTMPATAHHYLHFGEAWCTRTLTGAGGGR